MEDEIYQEEGIKTRKEYLLGLAEEYGVSLDKVLLLADLLGPDEDYDGLPELLEELIC